MCAVRSFSTPCALRFLYGPRTLEAGASASIRASTSSSNHDLKYVPKALTGNSLTRILNLASSDLAFHHRKANGLGWTLLSVGSLGIESLQIDNLAAKCCRPIYPCTLRAFPAAICCSPKHGTTGMSNCATDMAAATRVALYCYAVPTLWSRFTRRKSLQMHIASMLSDKLIGIAARMRQPIRQNSN